MEWNYAELWPRIVSATFNTPAEREKVTDLLLRYAGQEPDRVRLCILRIANGNLAKVRTEIENASGYWREIICQAESPLSNRRRGLREKDPVKYQSLVAKDHQSYEQWLQHALAT